MAFGHNRSKVSVTAAPIGFFQRKLVAILFAVYVNKAREWLGEEIGTYDNFQSMVPTNPEIC